MIVYYADGLSGGRAESHRLLERSISEYTGDALKAEELAASIKTTEGGKPYIEGFRHFSISHTGSIWAVLIDGRECGLDIQLAKKCDICAIARRVYHPEETAMVEGLAADSQSAAQDAFFRVWTRREALVKALGLSVFDAVLPKVTGDSVVIDGREFGLSDIRFPGMPQLYAAACVEGCEASELKDIRFIKL